MLDAGQHHQHKRKRTHQRFEPYPHPRRLLRIVDHSMLIIGILGPLVSIPQVLKIWAGKDASGISVLSWSAYFVFNLFWILYAILHKERPLLVTYIGWAVVNVLVVAGAIIYG